MQRSRRVGPHHAQGPQASTFPQQCPFYDGLYLALAEALGANLLSRDAALAAVPGCRARVEVLR